MILTLISSIITSANRVTGFEPVANELNISYHIKSLVRHCLLRDWRLVTGSLARLFVWDKKMSGPQKNVEDFRGVGKDRGIKWLGDRPVLVTEKTLWECEAGHQWETAYTHISRDHGCPECQKNKFRKQPDDYHSLANKKNLKWLGPVVKSTQRKTWWRCVLGHEFEAQYNSISNSAVSGCPYCSGRKKKDSSDYHELARKNGHKWLGPMPKGTNHKTWWRCKNGHEFHSRYSDVVRYGKGCIFCRFDSNRISPEQYAQLGKEKGFKWLGPKVEKVRIPTKWRCKKGHTFKASYSNIQQGNGCSICKQSKGEKVIANILDEFGIKYERQKSFDLCRMNNRLLFFDFYFSIDQKQFLVEYDGLQHFQPIKYFGGNKTFQKIQRADDIKNEFASAHGLVLIRISYKIRDMRNVLIREIDVNIGKPLIFQDFSPKYRQMRLL